ncbi:leucine-rich repeat protein 1-like [Limulus polyphemus]|uniref:Leucine-rich repeat protein 1-like n=1 Tax=Limulus polyphemus TaxID=6850 RepID=A0ABM1BKX8_LIMPO|nr:leucine-rich repeat protein 1-like [Limulus polyphemus]
MRLNAEIEVLSRIVPSLNIKRKGKAMKATLVLSRKLNVNSISNMSDVILIICTSQNPAGMKYKIVKNVDMVFTKFIQEGKATIRLKEPEHDIIIKKADPVHLKGFLNALYCILRNKNLDKLHLSAPPSQVNHPKTRLIISKRQDYPIRAGFPSSLSTLRIQQCNLCRVDSRILNLHNLQTLDLSNNLIKVLPANLDHLTRLVEINLNNNKLEHVCDVKFPRNLEVLSLNYNQLQTLPEQLCFMEKLKILSVSNNILQALPERIGFLKTLRNFNVSNNSLKLLPASFMQLRLNNLDLYNNAWVPVSVNYKDTDMFISLMPSLLECSASVIVKQRLYYTPEDLPCYLIDYLKCGHWCVCGKPVFCTNSSFITKVSVRALAQTTVLPGNCGEATVPLQVFPCSQTCWLKCQFY